MKSFMSSLFVLVVMSFLLSGLSYAQETDDSGKLKGKAAFETKCSTCHQTSRTLKKTKDKKGWEGTVKRMQTNSFGKITDDEVKEIVYFLTAKSTFETKCSTCHQTSRALKKTKDKKGWEDTVGRMQTKSFGKITDDEVKMVVDYLATERGN